MKRAEYYALQKQARLDNAAAFDALSLPENVVLRRIDLRGWRSKNIPRPDISEDKVHLIFANGHWCIGTFSDGRFSGGNLNGLEIAWLDAVFETDLPPYIPDRLVDGPQIPKHFDDEYFCARCDGECIEPCEDAEDEGAE